MQYRELIVLFAALLATEIHAGSPSPSNSPSFVLIEIAERGAKAVVRDLYDSRDWEAVLGQIRLGDPSWLNVAHRLRPGTDAGSSSELRLAISDALIPAPEAVLSEFQNELNTFEICSGSVEFADFDEAIRNLDAKKLAVERLRLVELTEVRAKCLAQLQENDAHLRRFYNEGQGGPPHNEQMQSDEPRSSP